MPPGQPSDPENGSFVARRQRLKERRMKSSACRAGPAIILVSLAFNVALIGARSEVVRYLPQISVAVCRRRPAGESAQSEVRPGQITKEAQDGVNILIIEGMIVNTANKPTDVHAAALLGA